jgi:hypothetical protein
MGEDKEPAGSEWKEEPLFRIRPEKSVIDEQNIFHITSIERGGGLG